MSTNLLRKCVSTHEPARCPRSVKYSSSRRPRRGHEEAVDVRACSAYLIQIGYISSQVNEHVVTRKKHIPEYVAMYAGVRPERRELDRFYLTIGFNQRTTNVEFISEIVPQGTSVSTVRA